MFVLEMLLVLDFGVYFCVYELILYDSIEFDFFFYVVYSGCFEFLGISGCLMRFFLGFLVFEYCEMKLLEDRGIEVKNIVRGFVL